MRMDKAFLNLPSVAYRVVVGSSDNLEFCFLCCFWIIHQWTSWKRLSEQDD